MTRVVEALVGTDGKVQLMETVALAAPRRAFVIILDDDSIPVLGDSAFPGEPMLGDDMSQIEEVVAWARLQSEK